jgi:hypothetical protein
MLTKLVLSDTTDQPFFKLDLPVLRSGDPVRLKAKQSRKNGSRHEVLQVDKVFRVEQIGIDTAVAGAPPCQVLRVVAADGKPCCWQSVKKPDIKRLAPTRPGVTLLDGNPEE